MEGKGRPTCDKCSVQEKICRVEGGKGPDFCPTKNRAETVGRTLREYEKPEVGEFARMASIQEAECYRDRHIQPYVLHPVKPRV